MPTSPYGRDAPNSSAYSVVQAREIDPVAPQETLVTESAGPGTGEGPGGGGGGGGGGGTALTVIPPEQIFPCPFIVREQVCDWAGRRLEISPEAEVRLPLPRSPVQEYGIIPSESFEVQIAVVGSPEVMREGLNAKVQAGAGGPLDTRTLHCEFLAAESVTLTEYEPDEEYEVL